ncbi:MAG: NADP(H)-dependent aldo-keto reductase [Candidatus Saccharimonadales bacterium]|nr:NADP(H)-dependent aldo-keto reductase [Candidatus Saccharimonadales bacterium]
MEKRSLGESGIEVPVICLGTMTWGQQNTEDEAHEQLDYAVDERGLFFIDTAEMYPVPPEKEKQGLTETYIGNWLNKRGKRDDLIIASKVGPSRMVRSRQSTAKNDRKNIEEALAGSLERLQTDYLDLYQIHWPERNTNFFGKRGYEHFEGQKFTEIEHTLEVLGELQKDGKIKHIGVSNETPWGLMKYLQAHREEGLPKIVSIQNQYSLTNRTFEIGLSEMTMRENIAMLAYSVLNMGVLSGKYLDDARPPGARFTEWIHDSGRYNPRRSQEAIRRYVELARDNDLDPAQLAIAFAVSRQFVTSVILGATSMEQLTTDIDAVDVVLSDEILDGIEAIHDEFPDTTH